MLKTLFAPKRAFSDRVGSLLLFPGAVAVSLTAAALFMTRFTIFVWVGNALPTEQFSLLSSETFTSLGFYMIRPFAAFLAISVLFYVGTLYFSGARHFTEVLAFVGIGFFPILFATSIEFFTVISIILTSDTVPAVTTIGDALTVMWYEPVFLAATALRGAAILWAGYIWAAGLANVRRAPSHASLFLASLATLSVFGISVLKYV